LSEGVDLGDGDYFRLEGGEVFSDSGMVSIGELTFDVGHDVTQGTSYASVDVKALPGEFGEGRLKSSLRAYVTPTSVYVTANEPNTGMDRTLGRFSIHQGELHAFYMDPNAEINDQGLSPCTVQAHPGFVRSVN